MRRAIRQRSDLGRILGFGGAVMVLALGLDRLITADLACGGFSWEAWSPDSSAFALRLSYLSVLLLFIGYVADLMVKHQGLEKALLKYQAAMDASVDGIFILDRRQRCVYVNQSHARLHGYGSHAEVLGRPWHLFYGEEEIRRIECEVLPGLTARGEWRGEARGLRRDGTAFPQDVTFTAIGHGSLVGIVRDVTEKKRVEGELERRAEQLAEANEELEAFGYSLTHDIRNYLTRIATAAQILRHEHQRSLDPTGRYLVKTICDAGRDMDRLIADMLILSRIERSEPTRQRVDLGEQVRGITAGLQAAEPDRCVRVAIAPELTASCDPTLMRIALDNLLRNAWKYTGRVEEARIEIGSTTRDGRRTFFVRDNGVGFDPGEADRLFRPFQRLGGAESFPGHGVGLATVQRIVQRHGGRIWGEGEPGRGATFFFTLAECGEPEGEACGGTVSGYPSCRTTLPPRGHAITVSRGESLPHGRIP